MALRVQPRFWQPALLAAAGLIPFSACGGATSLEAPQDSDGGSAGSGGRGSAGSHAGHGGQALAGTPAVGGSDSGGSVNTAGVGGTIVIGTGGSAAAGAGGAVAEGPFPCRHPTPLPIPGTGYERCEGDFIHRIGAAACPSGGECSLDSQCGAGRACVCQSDGGGRCVDAGCKSDSDCGPGLLCIASAAAGSCAIVGVLACQGQDDECAGTLGCDSCSSCTATALRGTTGAHYCQPCCAVGRPFLVNGEARLAGTEARRDWSCDLRPDLSRLEPNERSVLASHWRTNASMEHASVAAFSRFVLDLMSLGAPAALVDAATRAMLDESEHAKACFALAGAFGGSSIGPTALSIGGSLDARDLREIVTTTVLEGCVGETVAALEAAEALAHATDPAVRAALARIARDELQHAALAYRFIAWARSRFGAELDAHVRDAFAQALRAAPASDDTDAVPSHGLLSAAHRAELRAGVLAELVTPSVASLLAA